MSDKLNMQDECYSCTHKRDISGESHVQCIKPDSEMTGDTHGILKGWFSYPILFDPVWKTKMCANYKEKE